MSAAWRLAGLATALVFGSVAGCSVYHKEERPPWRAQAEEACLAHGLVTETDVIRAMAPMDGPGICGLEHPFKVSALANGSVRLSSPAILGCPMIAALDTWIKEVVQPTAQARFGEPVVRIDSMGAYSCRGINNMSGAKLSEHAFGNAIDVGGFVLASGRELNVRRGFNGSDEQERAFLHEAHGGACSTFTTVLGPGYNIFHYNHFHVDLAMHGSTSRGPRRYCKPVPEQGLPEPPKRDTLPDPPPVEEEQDIARAPIPTPGYGGGGGDLVASAPTQALSAPPYPRREPPRLSSSAQATDPGPAAGPRPRGTVPPLVTFGYVGTEPRARGAPDASPPEAADDRPPDAVPHAPDTAALPADPSADTPPPEGTPAQWDATSSIRRSAH